MRKDTTIKKNIALQHSGTKLETFEILIQAITTLEIVWVSIYVIYVSILVTE